MMDKLKKTYVDDVKPYILLDASILFFGVLGGMLLKFIVESL